MALSAAGSFESQYQQKPSPVVQIALKASCTFMGHPKKERGLPRRIGAAPPDCPSIVSDSRSLVKVALTNLLLYEHPLVEPQFMQR
jgi:hypothetical protein